MSQDHHFLASSSSSKFTEKEKDSLAGIVTQRIQTARSRSVEDQEKINFVLKSQGFRIEITQSIDKYDLNSARAYSYKLHTVYLYIKNLQTKNELIEGCHFSGHTIRNIKSANDFVNAIYDDYVFELGIKEAYLPIYNEQTKGEKSPEIFTEYYLAMERYAILREIHPKIVKVFFQKLPNISKSGKKSFCKKPQKIKKP